MKQKKTNKNTRSEPASHNGSAGNDTNYPKHFKVTFTYTVREWRLVEADSQTEAAAAAAAFPDHGWSICESIKDFRVQSVEPAPVCENSAMLQATFEYSQLARRLAIPSPVFITGDIVAPYLNGPDAEHNTVAILWHLGRKLCWNPRYWFWWVSRDSRKWPLSCRLRLSPGEPERPVELWFSFLRPEADFSLLPEILISLPEPH